MAGAVNYVRPKGRYVMKYNVTFEKKKKKKKTGDELNKPKAFIQILLLLYTICNMYITSMKLK